MGKITMASPRHFGKTRLLREIENKYLKRNPKATIARIKRGEVIIEEYIGGNSRNTQESE